jgi:hypothetical protein
MRIVLLKLHTFAAVKSFWVTGVRNLNMEREFVSEMSVYSKHLTWLLAQEFIEFGQHTSFKNSFACIET